MGREGERVAARSAERNLFDHIGGSMRTSLILSAFIVAVLGVSSALAQTNVGVSYTRFCTINAGYSIADVVATARGFAWSEETAPGLVMIRNGIAAAGPVGDEQFDFIFEATYPSYADMVEKRTALLQRRAATDGRQGLAGVATCTENVRIRNRRIVALSPGGLDSIQPETAMASTLCELNGATIEDAAALASGFAENLGTAARVRYGGFGGGPGVLLNSRARMDFFFPSFADFGSAMDALNQSPTAPDPDNPISCAVPSLSASYRIHQSASYSSSR